MTTNLQSTHMHCGTHLKISMEGSVYGLYAGLKRSLLKPNLSKKACKVPIRSPKVNPLSQTRPSI